MYVSVDIETTGLDPKVNQVIQFGAVIDDGVSPIESLPQVEWLVKSPQYVCDPYAAYMNADILRKLSEQGNQVPADYLAAEFYGWLKDNVALDDGPVTFAGKNFASFDYRFLEELGVWKLVKCHYRSIDVGSLYWDGRSGKLPSTSECLTLAGLSGSVQHTALADALDIVRLIRAKFDA